MAKNFDFKSTLNLPKTDFPMKAKLPEREPEQLAAWEEMGLYKRILASRADAPLFVLHDGPPYPTGEIHLGTGLNKTLKDMIVKSKTMSGFRAPYIPGWDCHGLPIETKVEKELGGKTSKVPAAEFRKMCRDFAARYVEDHKREFKRLGVFGQWDKPYLTMDAHDEACIAGAFIDFFEKGYIYRGLKPVYWCIYDRTALAEAEVEYEDHTSPSVWVKFPVVAGEKTSQLGADVNALIWTTTPWTLPANRALAFHPDFEYVVADTSAGKLLLAKERVNALAEELKIEVRETHGGWKGKEFEGVQFQHPFLEYSVPGVLADYVTLDQGSGIVHTAPGHGAEDFRTGQKYGLESYAPQDDDGRFVEGLPEYKGKTVFEANPIVIGILTKRGMLVGERKLTHSYPHCWRCHNPVIFRATEQWFIGLDQGGLRQKALEEVDKVKWLPAWGRDRMREMVAERPDWCISRQRFWGVPLIVFYCERMRKAAQGFCGAASRAAIFRARRRGCLVHAFRRGIASAGDEVLVRRREMAQGKRHSRCVVRIRLHASRRSHGQQRPPMAGGRLSRRPRPISRLVPKLAAEWRGHARRSAVQASGHTRLDARRKRQAHVEVARQRALSQGNFGKMGRGFAAHLGGLAGLHRGHAQLSAR